MDKQKLFQCLEPYNSVALAVSGGADSIALMWLLKSWQETRQASQSPYPEIHILTVDHGIRPESQHEVLWVRQQAEKLGFPVEVLRWCGEKARSSIQEKARDARYQLMSEWCRARHIPAIITAHHLDDQAETLIMRLARGSGVDGLAAISNITYLHDILLIRPLLEVPKQDLISYLNTLGAEWIEDPSNDNEDFERVRIRNALPALSDLGLQAPAIARSAKRVRRASTALDYYAKQHLIQLCRLEPEGYAVIDRNAVMGLPAEISLRCLTRIVHLVGGKVQAPSMQKMENLHEQLGSLQSEDASVSGCIVRQVRNTLLIAREVRRDNLQDQKLLSGAETLWDNRYRIILSPDAPHNIHVRFLTEQGYLALPDSYRESPAKDDYHFNPAVRSSLPSFWVDNRLISVPHLQFTAEGISEEAVSVEYIHALEGQK
ncbi:MAG: tRNA lysidine(34) synthetase TilS [Methyloligellaceae bacterium]